MIVRVLVFLQTKPSQLVRVVWQYLKKKLHADKARILINQGLSENTKYYHEYAGSNFRMTNMQASIGVAQLDIINKLLKVRKKFSKFTIILLVIIHIFL